MPESPVKRVVGRPFKSGEGKPFVKGKSGNPGGRTATEVAVQRRIWQAIHDGLRKEDELVSFAFSVMRGEEDDMQSEPSRVYAHRFLSEHYYGKPKETVDIDVTTGPAPAASLRAAVEALDAHERAALEVVLAGLRRAKAQGQLVDAESSQVGEPSTLEG